MRKLRFLVPDKFQGGVFSVWSAVVCRKEKSARISFLSCKEPRNQMMEVQSRAFDEDFFRQKLLDAVVLPSLCLKPADFIYARSNENYVVVHYLEQGVRKKKTIRFTLQKLLEVLRRIEPVSVVQCHRSYVVNTAFVSEICGNSHTMEYFLGAFNESIPVSRKQTHRPAGLICNMRPHKKSYSKTA